MNKIYLIVLLGLFRFDYCNSQTLKKIFLTYPDLSWTVEQREKMITNFRSAENGEEKGIGIDNIHLFRFEPNNGYLSISGAFEGLIQLVYWNLKNGDKLVSKVESSCGPICSVSINFHVLRNGEFIKQRNDLILPEITHLDFFDSSILELDNVDLDILNEQFSKYDLHYTLPQKGKNIIVQSQFNEVAVPTELEQYSLGWKMQLIWDEGRFKKGEIIE